MNTHRLGVMVALVFGLALTAGTVTLLGAQNAGPAEVQAPSASVLTVCKEGPPDCQFSSIQAAVNAALEGDVIKVAAGVYTGVEARPAPADYVGLGGSAVITQMVYIAKSISIGGGYTTTNGFDDPPDTAAYPTTLDAEEEGRVFFIWGDVAANLAGLGITGGNAFVHAGDPWAAAAGGGVYASNAEVTIKDSWVFSNTAVRGGGVDLTSCSATLTGNSISTNAAEHGGGLSLTSCIATVTGNSVSTNTASGYGGGLRFAGWGGTATVAGNHVYSNEAYCGGGLSLSWNYATVNGNDIYSNIASSQGGGLYLEHMMDARVRGNKVWENTATHTGGGGLTLTGGELAGGTAVLTDNSFTGNGAPEGGGVMIYSSDATLSGNTISSSRFGGGLLLGGYDQVMMTNNVIVDNAGPGLYVRGPYSETSSARALHTTLARNGPYGIRVERDEWYGYSSVILSNTILVSQTWGVYVDFGNAAMLEATLWGADTWANGTDWGGQGNVMTGTVNVWQVPAFVNAGAADYHIGPDSGALDAGVDAGVRMDMDHQPRPYQAPDLGADEYWPPGVLKYVYLPVVMRYH